MSNAIRERFMYQLINALIISVEHVDMYTANHQNTVACIARTLARELQMSSHEIEGVRIAGQLHDIGKIAIPASLLSKIGTLRAEEFALIKTHVERGIEIINGIEFPWPISDMINQHHERLDGSGYPNAISGEEINSGARILAVADTVNAITHARPYRKALSIETAISVLEKDNGTTYDLDVINAFKRLLENRDETLTKYL